jgi:chemotaxis receptor (MCP) glutamine deamidase CheD
MDEQRIRMNKPEAEHWVDADTYAAVAADVVLAAHLNHSFALCFYDAVEEAGALIHLKLATPGRVQDAALTDTTLSMDLALIDRSMRELKILCPRAQHWQAKLAAQIEDNPTARERFEDLLGFVTACLREYEVELTISHTHETKPFDVRFRPTMGEVAPGARRLAP